MLFARTGLVVSQVSEIEAWDMRLSSKNLAKNSEEMPNIRQEKVSQGRRSGVVFGLFKTKAVRLARRRECGHMRTLRWQKSSVACAYTRTQTGEK